MRRFPQRIVIPLALDLGLLLLCVLHVPSLLERARAPVGLEDAGDAIRISSLHVPPACGGVLRGDTLVAWNGAALPTADIVEFLTNFGRPGDTVAVVILRSGAAVPLQLTLVHAFGADYVTIVCIVGFFCWVLAVLLLLTRPGDPAAMMVHWSTLLVGVAVMVAFEGTVPGSRLGYISSILFFVSYLGGVCCFFLFTVLFPAPPRLSAGWRVAAALPAVAMTACALGAHAAAVKSPSVERFLAYHQVYDWYHALIIAYVVAGLFMIVSAYRSAHDPADRKRLQWVLWGLLVGPAPFVLLVVVPEFFRPAGLVPEELTLPFLLLIPMSFAIAIVRYHLFSIDLVIRRTTVYVIVIGAVLSVYALLVAVAAGAIGQLFASAGASVIVALLFEPLRVRVQRRVDRTFFRVRYDYREVQKRFEDQIPRALSEGSLARLALDLTEQVLMAEGSAFYVLDRAVSALKPLEQRGLALRAVPTGGRFARMLSMNVLGVSREIESGTEFSPGMEHLLRRCRIALACPALSGESELVGLLALGPKRSGQRFTREDLDLVRSLCSQAGHALGRLALQRQLFAQEAETRRLEEVSQMKSDFVSYVSHELRNPLTAMQLHLDVLRSSPRLARAKREKYLGIINGEAGRLGRMVTNILDAARIDQGLQEYTFVPVDLCAIVRQVLDTLEYQLSLHRFTVAQRYPRGALMIGADADAVGQAVANLIVNAIKYSADRKELTVRLFRKKGFAHCEVTDRGLGISPDALPHIFERFYRDPAHRTHTNGVGLGLPLVKHIAEVHRGSVAVRSSPGKGSCFTLVLPLLSTSRPKGRI